MSGLNFCLKRVVEKRLCSILRTVLAHKYYKQAELGEPHSRFKLSWILVPLSFFGPDNFGLKKIWVQIAFRVQKILSFKNLLAKKVLCPNKLCFKKDLLQKYFESKTNIRWIKMLGLKKILGLKKFWVQKNFGSKKVWVHRIMGRKKCWSQTILGQKKRFWLCKKNLVIENL